MLRCSSSISVWIITQRRETKKMKIREKDTVIFLGDSVTDCGRDRGEELSFGAGFANMVNSAFRVLHPECLVRFINKGVGGDQSLHILKRLKPDVLNLHPNAVILCVGINDVLRSYYCPCTGTGVSAEEYRSNMDQIIRQILDSGAKLLLMTPYLVDTNPYEPMRTKMIQFAGICKELSEHYGVEFLDLQQMFETLMARGIYSYEMSYDRIHPSHIGHVAIANALLERLEVIRSE